MRNCKRGKKVVDPSLPCSDPNRSSSNKFNDSRAYWGPENQQAFSLDQPSDCPNRHSYVTIARWA